MIMLMMRRRRRNRYIPPLPNNDVEISAPQLATPTNSIITTTIDEQTTNDVPSFIPIRDESPSFCNAWSFRPSSFNSLTNTTASTTSQHIDVIYSYYGFLESESLSHIPPEDFKFLENKGCFHVPARPVLDVFIKEYFLHVHPVLPLLNEGQFWDMYLGDTRLGTSSSTKISLFLFRAILFVSCSVSLLLQVIDIVIDEHIVCIRGSAQTNGLPGRLRGPPQLLPSRETPLRFQRHLRSHSNSPRSSPSNILFL